MAAGAAKVYREKVSGAKADRTELQKVVKRLEPGDVLLVCRLDRLARLGRATCSTCWPPSASAGRAFGRCATPGPTPHNPHGRLIVTVLAGLAEFERELIRSALRGGHGAGQAARPAVRSPGPS